MASNLRLSLVCAALACAALPGAALAAGGDDAPSPATAPAAGGDRAPSPGAAPAEGRDDAPSTGAAPAEGRDDTSSSAAAPAEGERAAEPTLAPVVVLNRTIVVLRGTVFGVSPADRARRAEHAIEQILAGGGPGTVTVQKEPQGKLVLIDGQLAMLLTEMDVDPARGETLAQLTQRVVADLQRSVVETAELRSRGQLLRGLVRSAIATGFFLAAIALVVLARRRLVPRLQRALEQAARAIRVGGTEVIGAERLRRVVGTALAGAAWLVMLVAAYRWLSYVLVQFPYTRPWGEGLLRFLTQLAVQIGGGILRAIPGLLVAVVMFLLARGVIGLAAPLFDRAEDGRLQLPWLDRDSARPTRRIVSFAVWLFAVVMAYPYLPGSQSEAFKGMSVLVGLMVTVGGASVFGQAASGLVLMYARVLRVGEYVRIADQEGTVVELGTFTTRIRTGLGEEVSLPNSVVLGTVTKNYSRAVTGRGYVVDTTVTIGYDAPWRQVEAMLVEAARRTPDVLADPPPRVFQTELADFYPQYRVVCQATAVEPRTRAEVLTRLHANIQDVFNEHGVQIMSPHYLGDPATPKVVPKHAWFAAPARAPDAEAEGGDGRNG